VRETREKIQETQTETRCTMKEERWEQQSEEHLQQRKPSSWEEEEEAVAQSSHSPAAVVAADAAECVVCMNGTVEAEGVAGWKPVKSGVKVGQIERTETTVKGRMRE